MKGDDWCMEFEGKFGNNSDHFGIEQGSYELEMFPNRNTGNWHGYDGDFNMDNAMKSNSEGIFEKLRVDYDQSTGHVKFTQDGVLLHERTYS